MVVTSGYNGNTLSKTETLTIGNNAQPPFQYPDHPRKIHGAIGGFLNKDFVTCGGLDSVEGYTDKCYMLGSEVPFATMMRKRWTAVSIVLSSTVLEDEKIWILGGYDGDSGLASTEYIFSDGRNEEGPPLPIALYGHAMVKINETTSFLVGGYRHGIGKSQKSWFYDKKWIDGPDLKVARNGLSLGIIRDSVTLHEYVVATGGYDDSSYLNDVEILDLQENKWEPGELL